MTTNTDPFAFSPASFSPSAFTQMPENIRAFAEKGLSQARDGYQKMKDAAETNNAAMDAAVQSAAKGSSDYTAKLLDIARTNTEGAFDFAQAMLGTKSMTDAFELMSSHARKQFELMTAQSKDLMELGKKVATDTVEPIKANAAKVFTPAS